jgi:hypothetical protein
MASIISAGTTSGTALNMAGDTSGQLQLATNGSTTAVTIDTSQNVGIGTASPSTKLNIYGSSPSFYLEQNTGVAGNTQIRLNAAGASNTASLRLIDKYIWTSTTNGSLLNIGNDLTTSQFSIDSSGNVTIVTGTLKYTNQNGVSTPSANGQGSIGTYNVYGTTITGQGSSYDISFFNKNQAVAGYVATGATTITTSSDERLKENLQPITNALATVNNLRTVTGNYKSDPSRNVAFFIAQDMQEHFPQAFEGANPDAFGINYNWTNPLLAAAIQELAKSSSEQQTIINDLTARITALEGAK